MADPLRTMQLGDILTQDRIRVPLAVDTISEGVARLLPLLAIEGEDPFDAAALMDRLGKGVGGELRRPSPRLLLLALSEGEELRAALGISTAEIRADVPLPGPQPAEGVRIVMVIALPEGSKAGPHALDRIERRLTDPDVESALLGASTAAEVRSVRRLLGVELGERGRVEHVLKPLSFRVYPNTPADEVVDLMARKELNALPVVGEGMEVLGIITEEEALRRALRGRLRGEGTREEHLTARDMMSRTVMCVSEDTELMDAAQLMLNKDMAQLPVVREGEIVGMLERSAVLRALFGM